MERDGLRLSAVDLGWRRCMSDADGAAEDEVQRRGGWARCRLGMPDTSGLRESTPALHTGGAAMVGITAGKRRGAGTRRRRGIDTAWGHGRGSTTSSRWRDHGDAVLAGGRTELERHGWDCEVNGRDMDGKDVSWAHC